MNKIHYKEVRKFNKIGWIIYKTVIWYLIVTFYVQDFFLNLKSILIIQWVNLKNIRIFDIK